MVGTRTRFVYGQRIFSFSVVFKIAFAQRFGNVHHAHTLLAFVGVCGSFRRLCPDKRNSAVGQKLTSVHAALLTKTKQPFSIQGFLGRNLTGGLTFLQRFRQRGKLVNVLHPPRQPHDVAKECIHHTFLTGKDGTAGFLLSTEKRAAFFISLHANILGCIARCLRRFCKRCRWWAVCNLVGRNDFCVVWYVDRNTGSFAKNIKCFPISNNFCQRFQRSLRHILNSISAATFNCIVEVLIIIVLDVLFVS